MNYNDTVKITGDNMTTNNPKYRTDAYRTDDGHSVGLGHRAPFMGAAESAKMQIQAERCAKDQHSGNPCAYCNFGVSPVQLGNDGGHRSDIDFLTTLERIDRTGSTAEMRGSDRVRCQSIVRAEAAQLGLHVDKAADNDTGLVALTLGALRRRAEATARKDHRHPRQDERDAANVAKQQMLDAWKGSK